MDIKDLRLHSSHLHTTMLPYLLGRVFHVTRLSAFEQIKATGEIRANVNLELTSTFGSTNSFFRNRGCVSFFDFRSASREQIEAAIEKCSPYNLSHLQLPSTDPEFVNEANIVFLFLSRVAHDQLIPWTKWKEEQAYSEQIVPWVEAGHPGAVPITSIEGILRVTIEHPPDSIAAVLRRRFQRVHRS